MRSYEILVENPKELGAAGQSSIETVAAQRGSRDFGSRNRLRVSRRCIPRFYVNVLASWGW